MAVICTFLRFFVCFLFVLCGPFVVVVFVVFFLGVFFIPFFGGVGGGGSFFCLFPFLGIVYGHQHLVNHNVVDQNWNER